MTDLVTTTSIVSGAIAALKTARDLVIATSNSELRDQINQALEAVMDAKLRLIEIDEENRQLKAALAKKEEIVGPIPPFSFFYRKSDTSQQHPMCPRCFQSERPVEHYMSSPYTSRDDGSVSRHCRMCGHQVYERTGQEQSLPPFNPSDNSWMR